VLKVAYLFQSIGARFDVARGETLHTLYTLRGLQQRGHDAILLALQGRKVICSGELEAIAGERPRRAQLGELGLSGSAPFKLFESAVRRAQGKLNVPYYALFDSYRMYDAGCLNLKGFELIHERYNPPALGGALASKRLRIPYVLEVNADVLEQRAFKGVPERGLRRLLCVYSTRLAFKTAARIICTSAVMKGQLVAKWGVDEGKVVVLPCAADLEIFQREYHPELVRQQLGLTVEPIVIWIGGYYVWQDLELLAESFSGVVGVRPDAKLVMVGDGERRAAFERKIAQHGIQDSVINVGAVPFQRVPELLSAADVAVSPHPSHLPGTGGTPMKLAEYMAAGRAIVATRLDQISVIIEDQQTGLLVPPGDIDAFTKAVVTLLNDPVQRTRLGQNARRQAVEHHSWEQYAERLEETYLDILGRTL